MGVSCVQSDGRAWLAWYASLSMQPFWLDATDDIRTGGDGERWATAIPWIGDDIPSSRDKDDGRLARLARRRPSRQNRQIWALGHSGN